MIQTAVGAANIAWHLCYEAIHQNAPASGVPTGLPSYNIVVAPQIKGP